MNREFAYQPPLNSIDLARLLQIIGDPTRLQIVGILYAEGEQSCVPLAERLGLPLSTLSNHLRLLRESGAAYSRRDGRTRWSGLRVADLESRFPGLITAVIAGSKDHGATQSRGSEQQGA